MRRTIATWLLAVITCLLGSADGEARIPTRTNGFAASGVIEGFFGPPTPSKARRSLFLFAARAGLNTYIYAPKNDPLHRARWREPYPADYLAHFGDLAGIGREMGVRFVFAISPGLDYDPAGGDLDVLLAKLDTILGVGVRDFCLFFDDVFGASAGADPDVQADIVSAVFAGLRARDPATSLCFISEFYAGTAAQLASDTSPLAPLYPGLSSAAAYAAYQRIPLEVPVMWTGPAVFTDHLTVSAAAALRAFAGRPVWLWDNYPVNDTILESELILGPYVGRDAGLERALDGILVNPMLESEASKIPLWTVGRALALGATYDPQKAVAEAVRVVVNQNRRAVRPLATLVSHFQSHPVIGDTPESAELAAAVDAFLATRSARSRRALDRLFRLYATNHARLTRELGGRAPTPPCSRSWTSRHASWRCSGTPAGWRSHCCAPRIAVVTSIPRRSSPSSRKRALSAGASARTSCRPPTRRWWASGRRTTSTCSAISSRGCWPTWAARRYASACAASPAGAPHRPAS